MSHLMNNYGRLPVSFDHGQGVWLWDKEGHKYLDALAGIAVNSVGHAHPRLVRAIADQASKLIHCSNYFNIDLQEQVAEKLVEHSGLEAVFFCNSGLEANECAIKIARKFGHAKGIEVPNIIVLKHAFHGRSIATLSATGNPSVREDFSPYTEGFIFVDESDLDGIRKIVEENKNVVAIFFEPILGEGGGVPVGAVVVSKKANIFKPGNHGSTFGGNPLAMRAALETLSIIEDEKLVENALEVGKKLKKALSKSLNGFPGVRGIRGKGLMLGIVLDRDAHDILELGLKAGLTFSVTAGNVIRLVPALTITEAEADELVKRITPVIRSFLAQPKI